MTRSKHPALASRTFDFPCLTEEREPMSSILFARSCDQAWRLSRRPRSPSSNHNVKEPISGANFHLAREATPPARAGLGGGVGGVYRRASKLCQMRNRLKFRFFVNDFRFAQDRPNKGHVDGAGPPFKMAAETRGNLRPVGRLSPKDAG